MQEDFSMSLNLRFSDYSGLMPEIDSGERPPLKTADLQEEY